jgi:hypothetical protein
MKLKEKPMSSYGAFQQEKAEPYPLPKRVTREKRKKRG